MAVIFPQLMITLVFWEQEMAHLIYIGLMRLQILS